MGSVRVKIGHFVEAKWPKAEPVKVIFLTPPDPPPPPPPPPLPIRVRPDFFHGVGSRENWPFRRGEMAKSGACESQFFDQIGHFVEAKWPIPEPLKVMFLTIFEQIPSLCCDPGVPFFTFFQQVLSKSPRYAAILESIFSTVFEQIPSLCCDLGVPFSAFFNIF